MLLYGTPEQHAYFLEPTVARNLFWGNALNPLDRRVVARQLDGYRIDGVKSFSSGSVGSDLLTFSAWHKPSGTALIAALPTRVEGITVNPDWDAFGQRQTDSGTVRFDHVRLEPVQVLQAPGATPTARAAALAGGAADHDQSVPGHRAGRISGRARGYVRDAARPWFASGVERHADDPYVQERFGEFWLSLQAARALPTRRRRRWTSAGARPSVTAGSAAASPWPARQGAGASRARCRWAPSCST